MHRQRVAGVQAAATFATATKSATEHPRSQKPSLVRHCSFLMLVAVLGLYLRYYFALMSLGTKRGTAPPLPKVEFIQQNADGYENCAVSATPSHLKLHMWPLPQHCWARSNVAPADIFELEFRIYPQAGCTMPKVQIQAVRKGMQEILYSHHTSVSNVEQVIIVIPCHWLNCMSSCEACRCVPSWSRQRRASTIVGQHRDVSKHLCRVLLWM